MKPMLLIDIQAVIYSIRRYRHENQKQLPSIFRPQKFNEHIFCKKLFDRNPRLTQFADKYAVREYVRERIGEEYLNKLYLVTTKPEEINFDQLPNRFVIKGTHGSGFNLIVKDKNQLNYDDIIKTCRDWLSTSYYEITGEWCYKHIPPQIIIEEFLQTDDGDVPPDFKFFCFNGEPTFIQVDVARFTDHKRNIYTTKWEKLPVSFQYKNFDEDLKPPNNLSQMLTIAQKLSQGLDFIRVDLYSMGEKIIFGELTNYPENGYGRFSPKEYDFIFGQKWQKPHPNHRTITE